MIDNELLDLCHLEKSDLRGLSANDEVVAVHEAARKLKPKGQTFPLADALTKTVVKKAVERGPVWAARAVPRGRALELGAR